MMRFSRAAAAAASQPNTVFPMSAGGVRPARPLSGARTAAITNTLNRAMLAIDDGNGAAFAGCFTAAGTCDVALTEASAAGAAELGALAEGIHAKFPTCRHWEGNVCVSGDGGRGAANRSYWMALDGGDVVSTGIHVDALELEADGEWRIARRRILHTWTRAGGPRDPGE